MLKLARAWPRAEALGVPMPACILWIWHCAKTSSEDQRHALGPLANDVDVLRILCILHCALHCFLQALLLHLQLIALDIDGDRPAPVSLHHSNINYTILTGHQLLLYVVGNSFVSPPIRTGICLLIVLVRTRNASGSWSRHNNILCDRQTLVLAGGGAATKLVCGA